MTNKLHYIGKSAKYIIGAAVLTTGLSSAVFGLNKDNGYHYSIRTKQDLIDFKDLVNSGEEPDAKGLLMNSIKFNEDKVVEGGKLKEGNFDEWEPIGSTNHPFEGELTAVHLRLLSKKINETRHKSAFVWIL